MKKYRVFPADRHGMCLRGFCPTLVEGKKAAEREALQIAANCVKYGFKYDILIIEES